MRFLLKLLAAPVVLALTLFVWLCMGVLYLSSLVLGLSVPSWDCWDWRFWLHIPFKMVSFYL